MALLCVCFPLCRNAEGGEFEKANGMAALNLTNADLRCWHWKLDKCKCRNYLFPQQVRCVGSLLSNPSTSLQPSFSMRDVRRPGKVRKKGPNDRKMRHEVRKTDRGSSLCALWVSSVCAFYRYAAKIGKKPICHECLDRIQHWKQQQEQQGGV